MAENQADGSLATLNYIYKGKDPGARFSATKEFMSKNFTLAKKFPKYIFTK